MIKSHFRTASIHLISTVTASLVSIHRGVVSGGRESEQGERGFCRTRTVSCGVW